MPSIKNLKFYIYVHINIYGFRLIHPRNFVIAHVMCNHCVYQPKTGHSVVVSTVVLSSYG